MGINWITNTKIILIGVGWLRWAALHDRWPKHGPSHRQQMNLPQRKCIKYLSINKIQLNYGRCICYMRKKKTCLEASQYIVTRNKINSWIIKERYWLRDRFIFLIASSTLLPHGFCSFFLLMSCGLVCH